MMRCLRHPHSGRGAGCGDGMDGAWGLGPEKIIAMNDELVDVDGSLFYAGIINSSIQIIS